MENNEKQLNAVKTPALTHAGPAPEFIQEEEKEVSSAKLNYYRWLARLFILFAAVSLLLFMSASLALFNLAPQALVVACVFMAMYLPCVATFFVMLRESGWKDTLKVITLTLTLSFITAFVLRMLLM